MALFSRYIPLFTKFTRIPVAIQGQTIHRWVAPTLLELNSREKKQGGKIVNPRNTYLEWNLEAELYAFGKRLNEEFDSNLLLQAFTDRSYVFKEEFRQKEIGLDVKINDNKELTEEGEQFMNKYIQLYLETVLPKFPLEGIKGIRQHLMSEALLSHISLHLGTKDIILAAEYPVDTHILSNTLKAIIGALLRSSGEDKAALFVRDFVITQLQDQDVNEYWPISNPMEMLTNILSKDGVTVEPRLIGETARNTVLACYRVGLYIDKKMVAAGFGESVATAKEMAAREALKKIFSTEDHMAPINFDIEGIPKPNSERRYQLTAS